MVVKIKYALMFIIIFSFSSASFAATIVGGHISQDTIWTNAGSPYIIDHDEGLYVNEGSTLIIKPGVRVEAYGGWLRVDGQLLARGTAENPIIFTSAYADPEPVDWTGINFSETAIGAIYSDTGEYVAGSIIEYSTIELSIYGIKADESAPFLSHVTIQNCTEGLSLNNITSMHIQNSNFIKNNSLAINSKINLLLSISGCTFTENGREGCIICKIYGFKSSASVLISDSVFTEVSRFSAMARKLRTWSNF
ncbi:MAG: hypothetical protein WA017_17375 [Desulfosalsimonadaceae bacterium]